MKSESQFNWPWLQLLHVSDLPTTCCVHFRKQNLLSTLKDMKKLKWKYTIESCSRCAVLMSLLNKIVANHSNTLYLSIIATECVWLSLSIILCPNFFDVHVKIPVMIFSWLALTPLQQVVTLHGYDDVLITSSFVGGKDQLPWQRNKFVLPFKHIIREMQTH